MKNILIRSTWIISVAAGVAWTANATESVAPAPAKSGSGHMARRMAAEPVTGSLIPARAERSGKAAPLPPSVMVYSQADIRRSGAASLGQFLGRGTASGH
jgi:hypothetical protein